MPVQRIPRYLLLFNDLQSTTTEGSPEHDATTKAHQLFKEIAESLNESKKITEERVY